MNGGFVMDVKKFNANSFIRLAGLVIVAYNIYGFILLCKWAGNKYFSPSAWSWIDVIFSLICGVAIFLGPKINIGIIGGVGVLWILDLVSLCMGFSVIALFRLLLVSLVIVCSVLIASGLVKELDQFKSYVSKFWFAPLCIMLILNLISVIAYGTTFTGLVVDLTIDAAIVIFEMLWAKFFIEARS